LPIFHAVDGTRHLPDHSLHIVAVVWMRRQAFMWCRRSTLLAKEPWDDIDSLPIFKTFGAADTWEL
jgi:hypothetical protein